MAWMIPIGHRLEAVGPRPFVCQAIVSGSSVGGSTVLVIRVED